MYILKNKLSIYTFTAILLKCLVFIGLMLDKNHLWVDFTSVFHTVGPFFPYHCSFIVLFLSFGFLFKGRYRLWFLLTFNMFVSALLLVDLWYLRGFNSMPSMLLIKQTSNLNGLGSSILSLINIFDFLFIADVIIILAISLINKQFYHNARVQKYSFLILFLMPLFFLLYIPVKVNILGYEDVRIYYFRILNPNATSKGLSPVGYHIVDIISFVKDSRPLKLTAKEEEEINSWFENKKTDMPDNKYKAMFQGKNLVMIQVESFENFIINQKINGQEITPNINKLIKNSLYFSNFYEQVGHGTTSDAELLATTSVYPVRQGSTFFRFPYTTYNSLPKLLKDKGYSTLAIHGDEGSFWNWVTALTSIGFEKCIDSSMLDQSEIIELGISDGSFLRQAGSIIQRQKSPFYTYLITLTSHAPFNLPKKYRELQINKELDESTLGGYFQNFRYVDKQIQNFIDYLEKCNMLDDTVIVIYGDHEGVHKYYSADILKNSPEKWLVENNKKVPFIVYQKGLSGEEIKTIGGQVDILPTISYLMGIDEEDYIGTSMGRNLLKTDKSFVVLNNGEYIGENSNSKDIDDSVKALDLADTIIKSNYCKGKIK